MIENIWKKITMPEQKTLSVYRCIVVASIIILYLG